MVSHSLFLSDNFLIHTYRSLGYAVPVVIRQVIAPRCQMPVKFLSDFRGKGVDVAHREEIVGRKFLYPVGGNIEIGRASCRERVSWQV